MKTPIFFKILFLMVVCYACVFTPTFTQAHTPAICQKHINFEEKSKGIESGLLEAIATIESKLNPYVVNVQGRGYQFRSLQEAARFVEKKIDQGIQNISVGPMQLHVPSHRRHFPSIEAMIDPYKNITYAARLFKKLKKQYGSCEKAVRYYHSANPDANRRYKDRVFGAWSRIKSRQKIAPLHPVYATKKQLAVSKLGITDIQEHGLSCIKMARRLRHSPESLHAGKIITLSHDQTIPTTRLCRPESQAFPSSAVS